MVSHSRSRSIPAASAGRLACAGSGGLSFAGPLCVGADVSKAWIDFCDTQGRTKRVDNRPEAIEAAFVGPWLTLRSWCAKHRRIRERLDADGRQAFLRLRRVHPSRARAFAQATGRLAKTDPLDAAILARFALFTFDDRRRPRPARKLRNSPPWSAA